jgi:16S rRNA (cytosine1402-N4)-methyltransferase
VEFKHVPVLLDECMQMLKTKKDGNLCGLHHGRGPDNSREILKRTSPGEKLIALDQDEEAYLYGRRG